MNRKTAHAGSFYPRFGEQIAPKIEGWIAGQPKASADQNIIGLIVPHAGYLYSGECAARAFHYISDQHFDSFIILHPSHEGNHFDYSVSSFESYETPFGNIDQDVQLFELLTKSARDISKELRLHESEHSMEIQLPLIKFFFPDALICPIMIGRPFPEVASQLAKKLYDTIQTSGKRVGIIVSTDLSHYYNSDQAEKMDSLIAKYIMGFDADGLWQSIISKRCEACGIGGILTLLDYAGYFEQTKSRIIQYTHSGKITGDNQQVVGYLSALIYN